MPSEDMLKQLLDEFIEKEALVTEELKVVNEQIVELESRLGVCRSRLSTIGTDRDKVLQIRTRYADGTFYSAPGEITAMVAATAAAAPKGNGRKSAKAEPATSPPPVTPPPVTAAPVPTVSAPEPSPPAPTPPAPTPIVASPASGGAVQLPLPGAPVELPIPGAPVANTTSARTGINAILGSRKNEAAPPPPAAFMPDQEQPSPQPEVLPNDYEAQWEMAESTEVQPSDPSAAQPVPAPQGADTNQPAGSPQDTDEKPADEENSDTVKSINDALRSLFR